MCEPTTIMALSALATAGGTYMQVDGARKSANFQAQVADRNAKMAETQAQDALHRGNLAQQQQRRQTSQTMGAQRAALAARGIDISEGSALSILEDTAYFGQMDEATIKSNSEREAWGFRVQGSNSSANAEALRSQASGMNPLFSAGTSLLGSASSVATRWYSPKRPGG